MALNKNIDYEKEYNADYNNENEIILKDINKSLNNILSQLEEISKENKELKEIIKNQNMIIESLETKNSDKTDEGKKDYIPVTNNKIKLTDLVPLAKANKNKDKKAEVVTACFSLTQTQLDTLEFLKETNDMPKSTILKTLLNCIE